MAAARPISIETIPKAMTDHLSVTPKILLTQPTLLMLMVFTNLMEDRAVLPNHHSIL